MWKQDTGEQISFWKPTLASWKKLLKNKENGVQDRTTGTKYREINETLDTAQGGYRFKTTNKYLTVEVLFKSLPGQNGGITASFKIWEELHKNLEGERHQNHIVYSGMLEKYKHLLPIIEERCFHID